MKKRRHEKILQIIGNNTVDTQEELLRLLREEGFDVTQATVSRDIKELRLVKTQTGKSAYVLPLFLAVFRKYHIGAKRLQYGGHQKSDRYGSGSLCRDGFPALGRNCGHSGR